MLCTTLLLPRTEVPRILHFTENTVPRFSSKDFRNHFRLGRVTFEIVLEEMAPSLTSEHLGGKDQLDIDKQLLLFVWYLANQESMREASNLFGISISTVHITSLLVHGSLTIYDHQSLLSSLVFVSENFFYSEWINGRWVTHRERTTNAMCYKKMLPWHFMPYGEKEIYIFGKF